MNSLSQILNDFYKDLVLSPEEAIVELDKLPKEFSRDYFPYEDTIDYSNFMFHRAMELKDFHSAEEMIFQVSSQLYLETMYRLINWHIKKLEDVNERDQISQYLIKLFVYALTLNRNISINSPTFRRYLQNQNAEVMRERRREKSKEIALQAAIEAELGNHIVTRPYKDALAMLPAVNRRLLDSGFAQVKVGKVERRLKKQTALLKSEEKESV